MGMLQSKHEDRQQASSGGDGSPTPIPRKTSSQTGSSRVGTGDLYQTPGSMRRSKSMRSSLDGRGGQEEKWEELPSGILFPENPASLNRPLKLSSTIWNAVHQSVVAVTALPRSVCVPIESLPPPQGEHKTSSNSPPNQNRSFSVPVRCPPRPKSADGGALLAVSPEADIEYLSRLYELRTWNMYRLITESREKRRTTHDPPPVDEEEASEDHLEESTNASISSEASSFYRRHPMIFAFDDIE